MTGHRDLDIALMVIIFILPFWIGSGGLDALFNSSDNDDGDPWG